MGPDAAHDGVAHDDARSAALPAPSPAAGEGEKAPADLPFGRKCGEGLEKHRDGEMTARGHDSARSTVRASVDSAGVNPCPPYGG
eukprot:gene36799-7398_t